MIYFGNDKIKEIYVGSDKIKEVYHGSDLVWKMDSGTIQDGYWVHRTTGVKTYFGADADFINNGVMSRPDWLFDAVEIKLCSGINDFEVTEVDLGGGTVYPCLVFTDFNAETGEGGNDVLQNIDMSNTLVNTLQYSTFYQCTSLISITLPEGLTSIGETAFMSCSFLTSITLPEGLTSIESYAFYNCASLTSITLPEGLTSIGVGAFSYCTSLSLVTSMPTIPPSSGDYVFYGTHANLIIKVPSQSVNDYKVATNWNSYANKISAI